MFASVLSTAALVLVLRDGLYLLVRTGFSA